MKKLILSAITLLTMSGSLFAGGGFLGNLSATIKYSAFSQLVKRAQESYQYPVDKALAKQTMGLFETLKDQLKRKAPVTEILDTQAAVEVSALRAFFVNRIADSEKPLTAAEFREVLTIDSSSYEAETEFTFLRNPHNEQARQNLLQMFKDLHREDIERRLA